MDLPESHISTYAVGLLSAIKRRNVRSSLKTYLFYQIKNRNWRAVRNYFNGYLAEWHYPPAGVLHSKAGRGWTRKAAIRNLGVHIAKSNAPELNDTFYLEKN